MIRCGSDILQGSSWAVIASQLICSSAYKTSYFRHLTTNLTTLNWLLFYIPTSSVQVSGPRPANKRRFQQLVRNICSLSHTLSIVATKSLTFAKSKYKPTTHIVSPLKWLVRFPPRWRCTRTHILFGTTKQTNQLIEICFRYKGLGLWPFSTMFQMHRAGRFYWWNYYVVCRLALNQQFRLTSMQTRSFSLSIVFIK